MKAPLTLLALVFVSLAQAQFVDVSPCHWAKDAVGQISSTAAGKPEPSAYLAENAVQQVFEGLKCGEPAWSKSFVQNAPDSFRATLKIAGFTLSNLKTKVSGKQATVGFDLILDLGDGKPLKKSGTTQLVYTERGWKVVYSSLSALGLSVFPK